MHKDKDLRFKVKAVEVEPKTVVEKEVGGKVSGKIKFWVLGVVKFAERAINPQLK